MSKVVIVSGGTSGIGQKCAEELSRRGYQVYATGRRMEIYLMKRLLTDYPAVM